MKTSSSQPGPLTSAHDLYGNSQRAPSIRELETRLRNEPKLSIRDFEIGPTLGTGTFGRVRQVRFKHSLSPHVFALKMLRKTEILKLNQVEHIKSEKRILAMTDHPFIVKLICSFQNSRYIYMLFEYLPGGELFSRLRKDGRFSEDVALFYASEILLALRYLHRNKIIYRDLKPENLLLNSQGHVKLADFGFAKALDANRTKTLCGTPEYLSPEIIRGQKAGYGRSADWWAFGILLYEMLVGSTNQLPPLLRQEADRNLPKDPRRNRRVPRSS